MRKELYFLLIIISIIAESCNLAKKSSGQLIDKNDPVQIAIDDFSRTCYLFKKDSIFFVQKMKLPDNKNLIIVAIAINFSKMVVRADTKVGSKGKIASRYVEKGKKLFFWYDDNYPLTEEALTIFRKYNLLVQDNGTFQTWNGDDAQKAAHYYFCKDNLANYKKVLTNIAVGYYSPPLLNCGSNN